MYGCLDTLILRSEIQNLQAATEPPPLEGSKALIFGKMSSGNGVPTPSWRLILVVSLLRPCILRSNQASQVSVVEVSAIL